MDMQRLGQHFLKDKNALRRIAEALEIAPGDTIIEIGLGHGELTDKIKNQISKIKIIGVERDTQLAVGLQKKYADDGEVKIIEGDALRELPEIIKSLSMKPYKLVGNIPYYITGKLLRTIGELRHKPSLAVIMIQKEVAERIVAAPPRMNRLAASVQFWAEPKILFTVPRGAFNPPPEVDSAVVMLTPILTEEKSLIEHAVYEGALRILFAQPRKTIENNLAHALGKGKRGLAQKILAAAGILPSLRPQDLTIENIARIGNEIREGGSK